MKTGNKTKAQLSNEVPEIRKRVAKLENASTKNPIAKQTPKRKAAEVLPSEEFYRVLFNNINDAIFVHELPNRDGIPGKIFEVNDIACMRLAYTREELLDKTIADLDAPDFLSQTKILMARLLKQKSATWEGVHRSKHGERIPVEISNHVITVAGRAAILSAVKDITIRKRAEEANKQAEHALRESERRYRDLVEKMPDGVYRITHEGKFLEVNPGMVNILGYKSKEELLAIDLKDQLYFSPNEPESSVSREKFKEMAVFRLKRKDGSEIWVEDHVRQVVDESGNILYHEGILRDVSERLQTENRLRESEQRFKTLAEATSEGIGITENGIILDVNDQHAKMHGYERSELIGKAVKEIVAPQSHEKLANANRLEDLGPNEYYDVRKDGSLFPVEVRSRRVRIGGRDLYLASIRDLTERKQAEEHIQRLSRVVEQTADSVIITDREGTIEYVNPAFEKHTGYSKEEALGKKPRIVRSGYHDAAYYKDMWNTILSGNVFRSLITNRKKNSELSYEEITVTPIKDEQGAITNFVATNKDVTSRRLTELALMESEHRFKTLAEASFEGIMLTERGVIVDCNDQLCKILGYDRAELLWKSSSFFVAPESCDLVEEAERSGIQEPYEHRAMRKDGTIFPVEARGRSTQIGVRELRLTAIRDITKQKQTEESLQRERNLLRVLIDNLPDLFYFKDAQCRYILNNPAHLRSIGMKNQEDVLGKTTFDFHPQELAEKYFEDEMTVVHTGKAMIGKEELCYRKDTGTMHWHLTNKIPLKDTQGKVTGFVCISHDITEQKRVQEAFQRERNFLRTLVDNLPDIVYFKDTDGRYVLNNRAHLRSIGAKRQEDVLGKTTFDFNPPELAQQYHEDEMNLVRTGNSIIEKEELALHRDTGVQRWHLTSKIPLIDEHGKVTGIVGISRDITDHKYFEEKIQHERNLLRTLIDSMPEFISYKDTDGQYLLNNRAHLHSLGVERQEEVLGKTMFDFHPAELAQQYYENEIQVLKTGEAVLDKEEMVIHRNTGDRRWHLTSKVPLKDNQGTVTSIISISTDITDRKLYEDKVQHERNLLRTVIDNLPDLIFYKDTGGRYILNNLPHMLSIGVERQEDVVGKTTFDFNPPDLAKLYMEDELKVIQSGQTMHNREEMALHRDTGEKRWHLTTRVPLIDKQGKVTGLIGIARDITERKLAEAERERLIKELQDALADIKTLSGLVPICANCKKIRDDKGFWTQVESYIQERSQARFSHGICPDCMKKLYPEFVPPKDGEGY
jgi:PAS domain S-box-containing protein